MDFWAIYYWRQKYFQGQDSSVSGLREKVYIAEKLLFNIKRIEETCKMCLPLLQILA